MLHKSRDGAVVLLLMATSLMVWAQLPAPLAADAEKVDQDNCRVQQVRTLPGSREFGSDFLEAIANDPATDPANDHDPRPAPKNRNTVWGLTADLSSKVLPEDRALYISKSSDGGKIWTRVARLDARYFDADIGEGERNGLAVAPGGSEFVVTTQRGAFQVIPQPRTADAVVRPIEGPRVPTPDPAITIPKKEGDPVTANVVNITADGKRLIVGYGYFDLNPQIMTYRKGKNRQWIKADRLPPLPTQMDIFSLQMGDSKTAARSSVYVGTGDQAFLLKARSRQWQRIDGVGDDSAIQGISTVGGPHLAACWGVYNPISQEAVERVTHASFLLHRNEDEAGPNIRAFGIDVDPARPAREIVTSLTGVYASKDAGQHWQRLNDLPPGEFRMAHFNQDGTVIVSGIEGTFLANPFDSRCSARLKTRAH